MQSASLPHWALRESSTPNTNTMEENADDVEQITDLCRLCASKAEQLVPIFQGEGVEHDLALKIQTYLPIQIQETDTLPLNLCHGCASTLMQWDVMLIGCVAADRKLRALQWRLQGRKESWKEIHERRLEYIKSRNRSEALSCSICNHSGMDFRQLVDHLKNHKTVPSGKRKHSSSTDKTPAPKRNGKRVSSPEPIPSISPSKGVGSVLLPVVRIERLNSGMMLRSKAQLNQNQKDSSSDDDERTVTVVNSQGLEGSEQLNVDLNVISSCESNTSLIESTNIHPRKTPKSKELNDSNRAKSSDTTPALEIKGTTNGVINKDGSSRVERALSSPKRRSKKREQELSFPTEISNPEASATSADIQCTSEESHPAEKPSISGVDPSKPRVRIVSAESINQSLEKRAIMAQKMPITLKPKILAPSVGPQGENTKTNSILIPAEVIKKIKSSAGPQFVQLQDGRLLRFSGVMGSKASFMSVGGCSVDPPPGKCGLTSGIYAIPEKPQQTSLLKSSSQMHVTFPPNSLSPSSTHLGSTKVMVMPKGVMPKVTSVSVVPCEPSNSVSNSSSVDQTQQLCAESIVIKKEPEDLIRSVNENSSPPPSTAMIDSSFNENSTPNPPPHSKKLVISFQQQPGPKNSVQRYTCTYCGRRNLLKTSLSPHAETHKPANSTQTSQFPNTSVTTQPVQVKYTPTPRSVPLAVPSTKLSYKFICQNCGKAFRSQLEVSTHVKVFCKATVSK